MAGSDGGLDDAHMTVELLSQRGHYFFQYEDGQIGRSAECDLVAAINIVVKYRNDAEARRKDRVRAAWAVEVAPDGLHVVLGHPPVGWTVDTPPDRDSA